jgi:hypothetical protein
MAIKTFTTGEVLTAADTNTYLANSGLVFVAKTTFTTSSLPFINGCFSSEYQNYKITMNLSTSASTTVRWRLRYGTSTVESGAVYDRFGFNVSAGVISNDSFTGGNSCPLVGTGLGASNVAPVVLDIFAPNETVNTVSLPRSWNTSSGANQFLSLRMNTTTAYTGFEIFPDTGTITGSIKVYGYRD